jgi:hypothetical protein
MKAAVVVFHAHIGEDRKGRAAGTDAEGLALKPIQEPDAANRQMLLDFMTSIWCGAVVGCIGAPLIAPQTADDESAAVGFTPVTTKRKKPVNCGDENAK